MHRQNRSATVIQAGDWLRVRPLPPGLHVLANFDVNDIGDRRVVYTADRLARERLGTRRAGDRRPAGGVQ
ncbi:MAG: hypothetical protein U0736_22455 [Gemmataceae bacterium]